MSLGLSPCWNHCSRVTKHKKLFLYISQDKQYFSSSTIVKPSLSYWKKPQVVEGFVFPPIGSYSCHPDNQLQAWFCYISRIPPQSFIELTDPQTVTENHCHRHSWAGSDTKASNNGMTSKGRSTGKQKGSCSSSIRPQTELQNGKIICAPLFYNTWNQYSPFWFKWPVLTQVFIILTLKPRLCSNDNIQILHLFNLSITINWTSFFRC